MSKVRLVQVANGVEARKLEGLSRRSTMGLDTPLAMTGVESGMLGPDPNRGILPLISVDAYHSHRR